MALGNGNLALGRAHGRSKRESEFKRNRLFAAFLLLALLCGGAGSHYPLLQLLLELLALFLTLHLLRTYALPGADPAFRMVLLLFVGGALLVVVHLVPLPPAIWHHLPARETAAVIFQQLDLPARWHALSLTPDATLAMLLALLPALAAFLASALLGPKARILAFQIIIAVALLSTFVAALQVAGQGALTPYATAHRGFGVGFFVNRNHQAAFLLVAMLLCAVPDVLPIGRTSAKSGMSGRQIAALATIAFLALGVLATTSRTAMVLLPLALMAAIALIVDVRQARRWVGGAALLYLVAGAALYPTSLVQRPLARMATASEDLRQQYWENSLYLIGQSLPWGTGLGSFDPVYRSAEPLDQVSPLIVNNAHNDFLEVALEAGVPGILLLAVAMLFSIGLLVRAWRMGVDRADKVQAAAALGGIVTLLLFSIVDYPLRMTALSVVAAILLGTGVTTRVHRLLRSGTNLRPAPIRIGVPTVTALCALLALSNGLSAALVARRLPGPATMLAPWSSAAWSQQANMAQIAGRPADSAEAGRRALTIAPLDIAALRAVASADLALGHDERGTLLFQTAAALGWRDRITQLWLIDRGAASGNLPLVAERADALLRQGILGDILLGQMRAIFLSPGGEHILADRLAARPPWRQGFLNAVADDGIAAAPRLLWLLQATRKAGIAPDPGETALIRWRLGDSGQYAAARAIWLASGGKGVIGDGGFEQASAPPPAGAAPLAWRAPTLTGVRAILAEGGARGSRQSLLLTSDGYTGGVALAQTIILSPGQYRVAASVRSAQSPILSVSCGGDASRPLAAGRPAARGSQWADVALRFTVPSGCTAQTIAFALPQTEGQPIEIGIDEVVVEPVIDR